MRLSNLLKLLRRGLKLMLRCQLRSLPRRRRFELSVCPCNLNGNFKHYSSVRALQCCCCIECAAERDVSRLGRKRQVVRVRQDDAKVLAVATKGRVDLIATMKKQASQYKSRARLSYT